MMISKKNLIVGRFKWYQSKIFTTYCTVRVEMARLVKRCALDIRVEAEDQIVLLFCIASRLLFVSTSMSGMRESQ